MNNYIKYYRQKEDKIKEREITKEELNYIKQRSVSLFNLIIKAKGHIVCKERIVAYLQNKTCRIKKVAFIYSVHPRTKHKKILGVYEPPFKAKI